MNDEEFTRCTKHYCRDCRAVLDTPTVNLRCEYHNRVWDAKAKMREPYSHTSENSRRQNKYELFGITAPPFDYEQYELNSAYGYDHEAFAPGHGDL